MGQSINHTPHLASAYYKVEGTIAHAVAKESSALA
jgi:hypothetical protein